MYIGMWGVCLEMCVCGGVLVSVVEEEELTLFLIR